MPRLVHATPTYRLHRPSGRAVVTIQGKDHYLGRYGTKSSKVEYDRVITEWLSAGRPDRQVPPATELTVTELIVAYWRFAERHYVKRGEPTAEQHCLRAAFRPLRRLYGHTPAVNFGPVAMKAVREDMMNPRARRGHDDQQYVMCRSTINKHVSRIRRMFRWAAAEELLPVTLYQALATLPGLQLGRCEAREPEPIGPVSNGNVDATLQHLPQVVADMVRFQLLTGGRPGEVCDLTPAQVDRTGEVWEYRLAHHKTEHHGKERVVFIGPDAQAILQPYLLRGADDYCFSPRDSEKKRRQEQHENRQTPLSYGNRPGTNRKGRPKWSPGDYYNVDSYRKAIHRACDKAFPPPAPLARRDDETRRQWEERLTAEDREALEKWRSEHRWSPNQLRHSAGTRIRKNFGLEAARVSLGHSDVSTTEIYAEQDRDLARSVARQIG